MKATLRQWAGRVVLWLLAAAVAAPVLADEEETIASIAKAFDEGAKAIRSGSSEGVIRDQREDQPEYVLKFRCDFQGSNQFLQIDYPPAAAKLWGEPGLTRIRLIWDGTACAVTRFSTDIHPKGCETRVYKSLDQGLGSMPASLGPVGDTAAWYPEQLLGKISSDRFNLGKLGKDRWLLKRKPDPRAVGHELEVEADPDLGFNLVRYVIRWNFEQGQQVMTRQVSWTKRGELWCVNRLAVEAKEAGKDKLFQKFSLEYTQFSPNLDFPAGHFGLGRLGIVEDSRILDERGAMLESIRFRKESRWSGAASLDEAMALMKNE